MWWMCGRRSEEKSEGEGEEKNIEKKKMRSHILSQTYVKRKIMGGEWKKSWWWRQS